MLCRTSIRKISWVLFFGSVLWATQVSEGADPKESSPADCGKSLRSVLQYSQERAKVQFLGRDASEPLRFGLADRPAVDCTQEIIQQTLPGSGDIEHLADKRGLGGLVAEGIQQGVGELEPLTEKRI